jgi:hypothetical protein
MRRESQWSLAKTPMSDSPSAKYIRCIQQTVTNNFHIYYCTAPPISFIFCPASLRIGIVEVGAVEARISTRTNDACQPPVLAPLTSPNGWLTNVKTVDVPRQGPSRFCTGVSRRFRATEVLKQLISIVADSKQRICWRSITVTGRVAGFVPSLLTDVGEGGNQSPIDSERCLHRCVTDWF